MSALPTEIALSCPWVEPADVRLEPMTAARLDAVQAIEQSVYSHPWARANFSDSIAAGYQAQCLVLQPRAPAARPALALANARVAVQNGQSGASAGTDQLLGYFIAMAGYREVHLLNITVAPAYQRQGWARVMLHALALWSRAHQAEWLWLEVRASNVRAQQVYQRRGFAPVGLRKDYYPAGHGQREDAVVMNLRLADEGAA